MLDSAWLRALSLLLAGFVPAIAGNPPVRLVIKLEHLSIRVGRTAEITVEVRDAYNNSTDASKPYAIQLEVSSSGKGASPKPLISRSLLIKPGKDSAKAEIPMNQAGIFMVRATHPELREDVVYLQVTGRASARMLRYREPRIFTVAFWQEPPAARPAARHAGPVGLQVLYPLAKLSANGSDEAVVQVFLDQEAPQPITLQFVRDNQASDLAIDRNQIHGELKFATETPGTVTVRYVGSQPRGIVKLDDLSQTSHDIYFAPAIKEIHLWFSPSLIPFGEESLAMVELLDLHGKQIATDVRRDIYLTIKTGLGDFDPLPVPLGPGASTGRATFRPKSSGHMLISASTYGATTREPQVLEVRIMSTLTGACLLIGGLVGGLLAAIRKKLFDLANVLRRMLPGPVVAFVLYGACVIRLIPGVSGASLSNPIGATVVSVLGGWGGVELLDVILKLFSGDLPKPA